MMTATPLLDTIATPADIRRLAPEQLPQLAQELRAFLLESVGKTGGHFASNLGVVELTIALHYVFETPQDHLVWDVGHQSYPHKILTGRKDRMHTIRQFGGLAGFPKRSESEYDVFGVGHSSTSIGAALGMAVADRLSGSNARSVAVIGDGAMTAGRAFEALNNAGDMKVNLLVVLNDNEMSISPNVGALPKYLARNVMRDMRGVLHEIKQHSTKVLDKLPASVKEMAQKAEHTIKTIASESEHVQQSLSLFENFGFAYTGAVDGHNIGQLVSVLKELRKREGPQLLHIITKKGHGYKLAEADPIAYHGPGRFDPAVGLVAPAAPRQTFSQVFGQWLCDMAAQDERLVGITPAMREGSGMVAFHQRYPARYFDVGIAEQHAVTLAAGLACEGLKPVVAIYSTFLQRAYDQLIHDVALQNLPVVFALDRAGLVGADGATHAGNYDIAFLRCIPNISIACPADERECRQLLTTAYEQNHPVAVRYPRGAGAGAAPLPDLSALPFGRGETRRQGRRIAILAFGTLLYPALQAAEKLDATVINMRWAKPLDLALLREAAEAHEALVTLEEGCIAGGAGSAAAEALQAMRISRPILHLGLPDRFIDHGDSAQLLALHGLNAEGIETAVRQRFAQP